MKIIQDFVPINPGNRPGRKLTGQRTITVHNTGNYGVGALAHARYIKSAECQNRQASWHFSVDDKDVYQHIPLDEVAYHAGDGAYGPGNSTSIAVEICEVENQAAANRLAAELVAKLITDLEITISDVKQHHDWINKDCPRLLRVGNRWQEWLGQVLHYMQVSDVKPADPDALLEAEYKRNPWLGAKLFAAGQPDAPYKLLICNMGVVWVNLSDLTSGVWPTGSMLADRMIADGELVKY